MASLPQHIKARRPQNARLGIKSSLSNIKRVISLIYLLYVANDRKGKINYSEEYPEGELTKIRLKEEFKAAVSALFPNGEADNVISVNPLITSQLEHLQVGLELVFQLGKINFIAHKASSAERTGGNRFAKTITFSKNIIYIDVYLSALSEETRKTVLAAWMKNEESGTDVDSSLYKLLTSFTEYLKMSVDNGTENRTFEQEGLYTELISGNTVIGKDVHEDVGPLRIYKSFVRENMHPYVALKGNEFSSKVENDILSSYLTLVSTDLDLRNSEIPENLEIKDEAAEDNLENNTIQTIYYGCPGTGKSFEIQGLTEGHEYEKLVRFDENGDKIEDIDNIKDKSRITTNVFRTTFHPDYDYSSFVGSYKPVMKPVRDENDEETDKEELVYDFVPQVFINAYVRAYRSYQDKALVGEDKQVYLIIEEINRGNCAQIFGDLFQLLDRRKNGWSTFSITPDAEIRKHLRKEGIECNTLALPPNLHIYATMNTSDQSLFPMDSAFKRRWAMKYVPIDLKNEKAMTFRFTVNDKLYSWVDFLGRVNPLIRSATESEDKQMGEFFIKESVTQEEFVNKVMFYLWNDVCKDLYSPNRIGKQYFLRSSDSEEKKDVFTFAELFGAGRFNEADKSYTKPVDLLEGFITKKLGLEPVKKEQQQNNPDNE